MLEAEAALTRTDWRSSEDGALDILSYAWERTPMPGTTVLLYGPGPQEKLGNSSGSRRSIAMHRL